MILNDDESAAFEIIEKLDWHDLCCPVDGIPKVVESLRKYNARLLKVIDCGRMIGALPEHPDELIAEFGEMSGEQKLAAMLKMRREVTAWHDALHEAKRMVLELRAKLGA